MDRRGTRRLSQAALRGRQAAADHEPHPRIKAGDAARSLAQSSTKQAFANAKVAIERLAAQLDKGQALDLRWTIIGLFVSAGRYVAQLLGVIHRHHPHCG